VRACGYALLTTATPRAAADQPASHVPAAAAAPPRPRACLAGTRPQPESPGAGCYSSRADYHAPVPHCSARAADTPSAGTAEFEPQFPDLESWVNGFFVIAFARPASQIRWGSSWWDHPETVLRLDALWRTCEAAQLDPVRGVAVWIRDFLEPNLAVLFSPAGPFADCGDGTHVRGSVLPVAPTPPRWWSASHWCDLLADPDR